MISRYSVGFVLLLSAAAACAPEAPHVQVEGGEPASGAVLIRSYGCGACHDIAGVPLARGRVGPPLRNLRRQVYIAGVLPNQPEHMITWLVNPQAVDPRTAMPNLGVTPREARDIAAYLYSSQE